MAGYWPLCEACGSRGALPCRHGVHTKDCIDHLAELARYKAFADEVIAEAAVADLADVSAPTPEWAEAVYAAARKHLGDTATANGGNGS